VTLPYLGAEALAAALPITAAIDALEHALLGGLDPSADPQRMTVTADAGQLLLMPSASGRQIGVKLVSLAPGNPARGQPRVQGVFMLFDPVTLAPVALVDGIALTSLRTPAVSALAVRHLAAVDARVLVVFGSGPQAEGHVSAMRAVRPIDEIVIVGRDQARAEALVSRCREGGRHARSGSADDVARADIVVCATTAREPLFDGQLVRDGACVVAVGSHEPTAREVDSSLVQRSWLVVEDVATALREAGDLVLAGAVQEDLHSLTDLVARRVSIQDGHSTLVKTVGMAWEDAVVGAAAVRAAG